MTERGIIEKDYQHPDFLKTEILPFQNFGTPGLNNGNCAGFAYYTQTLHDKHGAPLSGEFTFDGSLNGHVKNPYIGTVKWDISKGIDNRTLSDPGLIDYKDSKFTRKINENRCTEDEQQFVGMINYYWATFNQQYMNDYRSLTYSKGHDGPTESTVFDMMATIDGGYILTFTAPTYSKNKTGKYTEKDRSGAHAITLYDYQVLRDFEGASRIVVFKVYDSNAPFNNETNELVIEIPINEKRPEDVEINYFSYEPASLGYVMTDHNVHDKEISFSFAVYDADMHSYFSNTSRD